MIQRIYLLFAFFLLGVFAINASAQNEFDHFTDESGLSNNKVNCIIQDKFNFIWIGTSDGLNLFNGYDFKIYRNKLGDSTSLPDNNISNLFIDSKENLWITTIRGGVAKYNYIKDEFERIESKHQTNSYITGITEDINGNIWIASAVGLVMYNPYTKTCKKFYSTFNRQSILSLINDFPDRFPNGFRKKVEALPAVDEQIDRNTITESLKTEYSSNQINEIIGFLIKKLSSTLKNGLLDNSIITINTTNDGSLWIGYQYESFSKYDIKKEEFVHFVKTNESVNSPSYIYTQSFCEVNNELFIGYNNGNIDVLNTTTNAIIQIKKLPELLHLRNILKYNDNELLVVSNNNSIVLNTKDKKYRFFTEATQTQQDIPYLALNTVFTDIQNNKWLGSNIYGLYLLYNKKGFHIINKKNGLSSDNVSALSEDKNGNIWVGYYTNGIDCISSKSKVVKQFMPQKGKKGSFASESVFSICCDKDNDLWISNYLSGLQQYIPQQNNFTELKSDPNSPNSFVRDDIRWICEDNESNLLLAVHGGGLSIFNKKSKRFKTYRADNNHWQNSLVSDWLYKAIADKNGMIWIATIDGLSILNPQNNSFKSFTTQNSTLPHNVVNDIYIDSYNNAWIGTKGGLVLIENGTFIFHRYTTADGLPNNDIKAIIQDNKGRFWISTNKGLVYFEAYKDNKPDYRIIASTIRKFDIGDGISSNVFYDKACLKTRSGHLLFGSEKGITKFHPDSIKLNRSDSKIIFSSFKLFNEEVELNKRYDGKVLLSKPIFMTDTVQLKYSQNVLTFGFIALNYIQSFKNQYQIRMFGFDKNWRFLGNDHEATYTNLSPGTYKFVINACNNDGFWNENVATLTIIVKPPYWQTWWFRLGLLVIIITSIFYYIKLRIDKIRKQKIELERLVNEKTEELQQVNVLLEERQEEVLLQNEQIVEQNSELEQYSRGLEQMVKKRTQELSNAKEKAEESERLKTAFLANMSHELRTPLNAIVGLTNLITSDHISDEEKNEIAGTIGINSDMLIRLFGDIFDLSKMDAGLVELKISRIDVYSFLTSIYSKFPDKKNANKTIKWKLNYSSENVEIFSDIQYLEKVLTNLISNAFKYTEEGFIELGFVHQNNAVTFYVKDTGIGIPADKFDSLFKRFVKIEEDKSKLYRGIGIGLALCEKIAQILDGKMWIESEVSKGSIFYFSIPIKNEEK